MSQELLPPPEVDEVEEGGNFFIDVMANLTGKDHAGASEALAESLGSDGGRFEWSDIVKAFSLAVEARGEWAGAAVPIEGLPLVVAKRHPNYATLNHAVMQEGELVQVANPENLDHEEFGDLLRRQGRASYICDAMTRLGWSLGAFSVSPLWSLEAETKAMEKLKGLISEHQYHNYVLTGGFLEASERSGVLYYFRRLRPTVALRSTNQTLTALCALCMHPHAFYYGSYAGCMVPTDDLIAHLILMRGDERRFWSRCNQHSIGIPNSGV